MAVLIKEISFGKSWDILISHILTWGTHTSPREQETLELTNVTFEVECGLRNILVNSVRDVNFRFMVAEWLWIQAGLSDLEILAKYNSAMRHFSDDGQILSGAYGPRLMPQIPYILQSLSKPDSRQAVATIWTPSPQSSKDIPCTISLQWMIRGGFLNCTVNMRSSDVWLGLPYDFFTFSQLTNWLARLMGRPVGSITMNLASSHLYSQHFDLAKKLKSSQTLESPHIPKGEPVPDSTRITRMLYDAGVNDLSSLFSQYQKALSKNKSYALEVLHAIQPPY